MDEEEILDLSFENKALSKNSRENYKRIIKQYAAFNGKSIMELYEEADEEEEKRIRLKKRKYSFYTSKFLKHLREEGKSPNTRNTSINAIVGFYDAHDIQPPKVTREKGDVTLEKNRGKLLSKKEINRMVDVADARETAIIYIMAMSGTSQNELREMTLKTFLNAINMELDRNIETIKELFKYEEDLQNTVLTLEIVREKEHYRYITFIPPETINKIIIYLRERYYAKEDTMEDLNQPLILREWGTAITGSSMNNSFRELGRKAGFKHEFGSYRYWRSHSLRKYFISTIMNKLHDKELADYLAGHTISSNDRAYWFVDPTDLKERYLQALPHLSLENTEVRTLTTEDKERLEILEEKNQFYDDAKPLMEFLMEDPETQERFKNYMDHKT
ncbi:MAG: site-specific integrase [Methanobacterium sp.]